MDCSGRYSYAQEAPDSRRLGTYDSAGFGQTVINAVPKEQQTHKLSPVADYTTGARKLQIQRFP